MLSHLTHQLREERGSAMLSPIHSHLRWIPGQRPVCLPQASFVGCVCLLAALVLASCASASPPTAKATSTLQPTSTLAGAVTPRATASGTAGPMPVTGLLAPPPQNCALTPPPQTKQLGRLGLNSNVQLQGGGPFWIYGGFYQSVLHLGPTDYGAWPITKMVVEVGPDYAQPVTLQLWNQETGALAWWTDGGTPPGAATQTLVLDPQMDREDVGTVPGVPDIPHGAPEPDWKEWGVFPLFEAAGCYALEVSWAGGSWQAVFAVGN